MLQEKQRGKESTDLENILTEKLMNTYLQEVEEEVNLRKMLKWKNFKKLAKQNTLFAMKKRVEKDLGRERSDIRKKIEAKRLQVIKKLKAFQELIQDMQRIKEENENDARCLPLLEETIEKNRIMRTVNYKDHIRKVLETRMSDYWRKLIKNNREGKKRIQLIVKEANYGKMEIEKEQTDFQEIMGLYGEEAYKQQETNPVTVMEAIFKM
jgi:hypothetical protein